MDFKIRIPYNPDGSKISMLIRVEPQINKNSGISWTLQFDYSGVAYLNR